MSGRRRIGGRKWPTPVEMIVFLVTMVCSVVGGFVIGSLLAGVIFR